MNKVRIGVVGLGRLGQQHADNIVNKIRNAKLSAVCSVQENELYRAKKEWGVDQCNTDYDEMIEQVDLDAVAIISPSKYESRSAEPSNGCAQSCSPFSTQTICNPEVTMNLDSIWQIDSILSIQSVDHSSLPSESQ